MGPPPGRSLLSVAAMLMALPSTAHARFGDRLGPRHPPPPQYSPQPTHKDVYEILPPDPPERRAGLTEAHRLEMSTEFFVVPERPPPPIILPAKPSISSTARPRTIEDDDEERIATVVNATAPLPAGGLRREPWALPLLAISCFLMLLMAAFEAFVVCKVWRAAPSRRHLFLGQMLLLGLFSCAAQGALLAASPSPLTCAAVRFGAGVSLALVFSTLLVKCVFLISLNGGVYLPAPYQALLLFFAVSIQIAVGAQWLAGSPPRVGPGGLCRAPFTELLLSLVYVAMLAGAVGAMAAKSRGIRDNHREAGYIAWAAAGAWVIAAGWAGGALLAAPRHRDGWLGGGMALTAGLIFLVMFAPKGRQLAALGRGGTAPGEREERLSSLSRAGSGYSPSFFHFKPVKYGVVGVGTQHTPLPTLTATRKQPLPPPPADRYPAALTRVYCYPGMPPLHPYHFLYQPPRFAPGLLMRSDDGNMYTTLEPTFSSNPNVYFQRNDSGVHPGMMY